MQACLPDQRCCFRPPSPWINKVRLFVNYHARNQQLSDAKGNNETKHPGGQEEPFVTTSISFHPFCQRRSHNALTKKATLCEVCDSAHFGCTVLLPSTLNFRAFSRRGEEKKKKANSVNPSIFTAFAKFDIFQSNCEKHAQSLPTA